MAPFSQSARGLVNRSERGKIGGLTILPPLSVEEERQLHQVIKEGRAAAATLEKGKVTDPAQKRKLQRLRHAGQEAESTLLRATCGLVRARVTERGYRFGSEELEAAGVEALVNAINRFEPDQGNRFSTYANYWIMKLVNQAIQQQAGLSDAEMRLVLKYQKLERTSPGTRLSKKDVAEKLEISQTRAAEVMQLSRDLQSRRFVSMDEKVVERPDVQHNPDEAPYWVIEELKRLCGDDFNAFWQVTFKTMSIDEIARSRGMSRQAMTKRIENCRKLVRQSPQVERLREWFNQQ